MAGNFNDDIPGEDSRAIRWSTRLDAEDNDTSTLVPIQKPGKCGRKHDRLQTDAKIAACDAAVFEQFASDFVNGCNRDRDRSSAGQASREHTGKATLSVDDHATGRARVSSYIEAKQR